MRAVIQRVKHACVTVDDEVTGQIGPGLLVLLGCAQQDTDQDLEYVLNKTLQLRIFADEQGKMNLSLLETGGQLLVVSQFTLYGDVRKGRRPSFVQAMDPALASPMIDRFVERARQLGVHVQTGRFAATMQVTLLNDGPVTLIVDSASASRLA